MTCSPFRRLLPILFITPLFAQSPSVELMVKAKSGFLGLGGPRVVRLELANELRQFPLTSDNVNEGERYYFLCSSVGDWQIDADFSTEELAPLSIRQDDASYAIEWKGEIVSGTILLGFPKLLKLHHPFMFVIPSGDTTSHVEMMVTEEFWPGFTLYTQLSDQLTDAERRSDWAAVISACNEILSHQEFDIFPSFAEVIPRRTAAFSTQLGIASTTLEALLPGEPATLRDRIAGLDSLRPQFSYVADSLLRPDLQVTEALPPVAAIVERTREAQARLIFARDSLQQALDLYTIRWILEGSFHGKNALRFQEMIEALVYAFSTVSPADTVPGSLAPRLPGDYEERLAQQNLTESYQIFVRMCLERYAQRAPLFPPEFLPNLRKDSATFALPYYSMLRATGEYFGGSLAIARAEIATVIRTCYNIELTRYYDLMRMYIGMRENPPHPDIVRLLDAGRQREGQLDTAGVHEAYRLLSLLAPSYAYGYYVVGTYYLRMNDNIRALNSFQKAYQLDTLFLTAYREAFLMFMRDKAYDPAISVYQTALLRGNDSWEVRFNLGMAFLGRNESAKAVAEFEKAIVHNPKSYDAWVQSALAYQALKNYSKARQCLGEALNIDPGSQRAVDLMKSLNQLQSAGK